MTRADDLARLGPGGLPYRPCAGVVLMNRDGLIWAGQRLDRPGAWQMPQGGIDAGETARQAAMRELTEETGIPPHLATIVDETPAWVFYDLPPELLGTVWKGRYCGQRQKWFLLRYQGTDADIDIATDHPEFDRWQWMTPADLLASIVPFKRDVYDQILSSFQSHLTA